MDKPNLKLGCPRGDFLVKTVSYLTFCLSLSSVAFGLVVFFRALTNQRFNFHAIKSIKKPFSSVTELTGITFQTLMLEAIMRSVLLLVFSILFAHAFSLSILQLMLVALGTVSLVSYFTWSNRKKIIIKYREQFELEFSDFVESLALAINSGLPLIAGLNRAMEEFSTIRSATPSVESPSKRFTNFSNSSTVFAKLINTPINRELANLRLYLDDGLSAAQAFDKLSRRLNSNVLSNFSDAIALSISRGTPLSNLISDHAQTIREVQKRKLMERAGRAEVKLMVPVIFLLLPISVLFALWPSFQQLQQLVVIP